MENPDHIVFCHIEYVNILHYQIYTKLRGGTKQGQITKRTKSES